MVDVLAPLALVGLAAFVVVFVRTARKQGRERTRLFRELASAHGWRFLETGPDRTQMLYGTPLSAEQVQRLANPASGNE